MADQLSLQQSQKKPRISKHEKSISSHHFQVPNAVISKRIYFYKSGDPQFSGIRMAINNRTFKTFDSLLDDLSNKIPLPFGVRTITTPHGSNSVKSLSDLKDGQSYICSDQRRVKPINLEVANRKQHPWFISKSFNREQLAIHQTRMKASRALYEDSPQSTGVPKKLVIFRNGDPSFRRNLVMNKQTVQNFEVLLKYITDLMHFPVVNLYSTVGKRIETLYPVKYVLDSVVAAGQEAYKPRKYDVSKLFLPSKFPAITNHIYPNSISKADNKNHKVKSGRRQWMINSVSPASSKPQAYSASSAKLSINDSKKSLGTSFSVTKNEPDSYVNCIYARGDNPVMPSEDDIEKSVYMNEDGSVTVEMKVHFRIKEEEVIEWTTTISNPGVCDKRSNACNSKLVSNVEAGDFVNLQSHHESRTMQFEDLEPEQVFDDLCTPPKFTMDIEMDKEGQYDIWQNNFSSTNDNLLESGVELCHYKGSPGHKSVKQGEGSQESIIAKFDTQSSGNIIQFPNIEETGLGEFTMEHDNEHFSIANEKNSHKIISDAISDNPHTREEINVNTHGKEKTMQDKSTSFVGKDSSRSSQPYFEDQLDAPKMINSISESTNAANVLSEYCGENGCADSNINLAKIYVRPSSGDPMCSISKQRKKDRRPMSASFQYSKASVSIHHETCNLSYGEVDSLTSIEKKQRKGANTSCTNSSGFCETRMSVFLSNLNSVSMCSPSSTVQYQNYTKTDKEVKMLTNTDSNDLSFTNEERAFSKTVNTSLTNTDLDFPSKINEQNCRKDSSENKNLYLKYGSHSQPSQILWQSENNEDVSDICTIPNGGHELTEVIDSDKYECTECNTTEIPDESKEGFHIGSGGDGTICHCLTDLKSPNEETNSNLSQLPVACPVDKRLTDTELLENRPHRIEDQHFITISNSYVTPSMPENISVANTCQDTFSEHEETSLMIACAQQLDQYHKDDDQCSTTTTEHNFNLSGSSSPMIGCDSESTSFGNGKQIAGINSSSFESAIPQCSSKPIRKKWKHVAKRNNKILNISTVEKDFKQDAQSAVLFPFLLPKNQELCNMDIPSSQKVMQNLLRSISPTSDLMHNDKDLGSYPPTSFAEKRTDNDLTSDVIKEASNLSDKDSDINDQSERNKAGANVLTEQKLEQSSDEIVCNVERIHEVSDDCSNNYLLQSQLNIAEGEIKHAPISNEIWCQPITEVTKVVSNMSELKKETNEIAIQVDTGVVSEMADERNSMEEQDLRQVLCQLQSTVDTFKQMSQDRQKKYLEKSYGMPDMSEHLATTLSTPSKVLLAWLAVINLNVSLPPATEGALMNNCSCSEVLTFLELIRHVVKFQEADDSKQNISELQKYASHLVKLWANDYKEVSNYVCYNDPKLGCSVQTGTTTDKQTVVFGAPQLTINADNENYLDLQNLIEPNETKREVKINFSTYPNEEGKNKEAAKEVGNKEVGLLNFKDNLTSDILEDQVTSDSIHQNEHVVENTVAMNMEWSEIKAKVLQQDEHLKTGAITQHEELIDNTMENNENGHPVCLRGVEANDQFTHCNATASTDGFLAVSGPMHPQTKIFPQSSMAQESLLAIDKYGPNHGNDFCQGEHMRRNHSSEMPVGKVSVFYNSDFENENKTDGKQQANKISENSFIESKADNMELLPYICPCVPSDHDVKQSLQRQQAHDLSEGDQTSVNSIASDYNSQASNEMTTEGEEDNFVKIKHFSANFVRKATERLYGKSHIASKLHLHNQSPLCNDKSTVGITCIAKNEPLNISGLEKGQTLQKSKNTNSHSEEEGVLIEKGRWLLKENHLIRKSPPSNLRMYENLDTTSDDTTLDNTSDDTAYPHVNAMHSRPPLSELSSSEIEEMIKPGATCNYFSMPHASDSEPFSDQISLKSKQGHVCNDSHFSQKNESGKQLAGTSVQPTKLSFKGDNNDSPFASVGLHMFDNKVSPLAQPLPDGTVVEQAPGEAARINRTLQNPDSLDKLHFLCGQHCPILTAVIQSSNEESRRFVYQKKSDPENQWVPYLENEEDSYTVRKYNGLMTENGKCTGLSKKIIDSIISDIHNWFKTPNIDNDINRIKSSLDAKYLGANNKILKPPLHTDKTRFKHKGKPFLSNVVTEAKKNDIKNIVEQWFMKQEVQNNIKAIKERINALSVQVQKLDNPSSGQTDPYHLSTRMPTANNNVTIPLMENKIIGVDLPSENGNRNGIKWKVTVRTSDLPTAGTTAQVHITFYGDEGNSRTFLLHGSSQGKFQSGQKDVFIVNTKNIGKLYKIRVGHNNAGEFPGWHCESIHLQNILSGKEYYFAVNSWMAQKQDDGEICREMPVLENGKEVFPVTHYEILIVTGDLWNSGTEANVFIMIYGKRGDTGSRQLLRSNNPLKFRKGQTDIFSLKAVHLGKLQKLVVGHDGLGAGNGWFLEKITIKDSIKGSKGFLFPCHRWLDQGEEDGKIARELYVADNFTFPAKHELELRRKEIWAVEKWKFMAGRILQFYCKPIGKFIRLMPDGTVDATGEKDDHNALFEVSVTKKGIQGFSSVVTPNLALAIEHNHVTALERNGPLCELTVHPKTNRSVILESVQIPGQIIAFNKEGKPVVASSKENSEMIKDFVVHVKNAFEDGAIVLLNTSLYQSLYITSNGACLGTGKQFQISYLRMHEVSHGVYMFESVQNPQKFIQMKDGKCDGQGTGDEYCQFKVHRNVENATICLESVKSPGMYLGLLSDGRTSLFEYSGEINTMFYPQAINMKSVSLTSLSEHRQEKPHGLKPLKMKKKNLLKSASLTALSQHKQEKQNEGKPLTGISPDEWKVVTKTGDAGTKAHVSMWVCGDQGTAGPISLQKSKNRNAFLSNQTDEFQINLKNVGQIYKIRIAHDGTSNHPDWKLEKIMMQHLESGQILTFNADRWLSRQHDDGEIVREFPLSQEATGKPVYPVMKYQVRIHTGHLESDDSFLPIHICIYGKRGDTGLRYLYKFDQSAKLKKGQTGLFQLEAVSLGELQKVLLHTEILKNQPWFCEQVVIKEQDNNKLEYVFSCNRWFPYTSMDVVHTDMEIPLSEIHQEQNSSPKEMTQEIHQEQNSRPKEITQGERWEVIVTTGNFQHAGTEATVIMYMYGDRGTSGPIILSTGKQQLFKAESTDIFKINPTDVGELYKIRIGHDNDGEKQAWFLDDVKLKELNTGRVISIPVNRWFDENQDDGDVWREFPITKPGEKHLPVLLYHIHVFTGDKPEADTDANVYINILGERGDTGKRKLHKSQNNQRKFQKEQMDTFILEAVSVGILKKIVIGHDGVKAGSGWFLDKVIINYEENGQEHEDVFTCNRWLDLNRDDQKTERELIAKTKFKITLETAEDSMTPENVRTTLVVYGSKGKSDEIILSSDNPQFPHFLPGSRDEFTITIENLGDIYKIRVNGEELFNYLGWHLVSITLEDLQTKQIFSCLCNSWLSAIKEDKELVKEFSVTKEGLNILPVNSYLVYVHTGDCWGAETFANVFITLHGERGDTGIRKLEKSSVLGEKFQQNKTDSFLVKAISLGQLTKVIVGHDGEGYGAGMYLKMITVRESKDLTREWVFPCWSWLDDHIGTKQTIRELTLLGERLVASPKHLFQYLSDVWILNILSSDLKTDHDPVQIVITLYGKDGQRKIPVDIADETTQVKAELAGVGLIYKLRVSPKPNGLKQPWKLGSINMKQTSNKAELWFAFNWWIKPNTIQGRELPALNPMEDPFPVVEYNVHIYTGDMANASTVGTAFIIVHGDKGDSGEQWLTRSNSEFVTFYKGKMDTFRFSAACLGKLYHINVGYKSQNTDDWFLEKIIITEGELPISKYTFIHNNLIGEHQKNNEFSEAIIHLKESVDIFTNPMEHIAIDHKEQWWMWMQTMSDSGELLQKPEISIIVFGTKGKTPLLEIANMKNIPFEVTLEGIGEIKKVSFVLLNPNLNRGIRLLKLRMKNLKTKQELGFNTAHCWLFEEHGSETVAELAAIQPDRKPLRDILYSLQVFTGNVPAASTDADVSVIIFGEHGDTGKRKLRRPRSVLFKRHQVNVFHLQAVDLGIPTLVQVEHDSAGYGAGWYLETVSIMEPKETSGVHEYVFPCQQWLDSEVADRQTEKKLKLLGKVSNKSKIKKENLQESWDVFVVTSDMPNSGTDVEVTLTVCCKNGPASSIILRKGSLKRGYTHQTSLNIPEQLGAIIKLRLEREESKTEDIWHCHKVELQHHDTKEVLEFLFLRSLSQVEGCMVMELPVIKSSTNFLTVKEYTFFITSGSSNQLETGSDVYITLQGTFGDTGKRKLNTEAGNKDGTIYTMITEAVDVGELQTLTIQLEKGPDFYLEEIIVREGKHAVQEAVFTAAEWLRNPKGTSKASTLILPITELQLNRNYQDVPNWQQLKSGGKWKICLSRLNSNESSVNRIDLEMVVYGAVKKSTPIPLVSEQTLYVDLLKFEINLPEDIGQPWKIRLGIGKLGKKPNPTTSPLLLSYFKMQNITTLAAFSYSIQESLPVSSNGDNWLEFPVEWPQRPALNVVSYQIKMYCSAFLDIEHPATVSLCLYGANGDTGDRSLIKPFHKETGDRQSYLFEVNAVHLGSLHTLELYVSSIKSLKIYIKEIYVNEVSYPRKVYAFTVNEHFAVHSKKPPTSKKIPLSGMINNERAKSHDMPSIKDSSSDGVIRRMGEYLVKVYTGDHFGEGTNANFYIVLFGDKAYSNRILLTETYDHHNPFEKGQVDIFKIITDLLGGLYKIEIGFDEENPGSGWYLEKVEITNLANNERHVFSCNRWLSLDTGTMVQLYIAENYQRK